MELGHESQTSTHTNQQTHMDGNVVFAECVCSDVHQQCLEKPFLHSGTICLANSIGSHLAKLISHHEGSTVVPHLSRNFCAQGGNREEQGKLLYVNSDWVMPEIGVVKPKSWCMDDKAQGIMPAIPRIDKAIQCRLWRQQAEKLFSRASIGNAGGWVRTECSTPELRLIEMIQCVRTIYGIEVGFDIANLLKDCQRCGLKEPSFCLHRRRWIPNDLERYSMYRRTIAFVSRPWHEWMEERHFHDPEEFQYKIL